MWLFEFLLGMVLAYLILSPRLRRWIFHRNKPTQGIEQRVKAEEKREKQETFTHQASINPPTMPLNKHESVTIKDESELHNWLKNNPELRKMNNLR